VELCESAALELLFQSWSSAKHALKVVVLQIVVIARVPVKVGAPTQSNKGFKWRVSLVLVLDYLQQVVIAHLQKGSICSRREENPVLQKRRVSSSVPSSLRATTRQLCSHGRWDRACYGRRRRSEAKMETRQTHRTQARRGEREVAADRIFVAIDRIKPGGAQSRRGVSVNVGARGAFCGRGRGATCISRVGADQHARLRVRAVARGPRRR
jgi:hypothetical protein